MRHKTLYVYMDNELGAATAVVPHPDWHTVCTLFRLASCAVWLKYVAARRRRKKEKKLRLRTHVASEIMNDTTHSVTIDGTLGHNNLWH